MRRFLLSKLTKNISIAWRLHFAILAKHPHNRVTRFRKKKTLNRVALCHPGKASAQKRGGERGKKNPHKWENKHHNRVTRFQKKKTSIAWHFAILAKAPQR